MGDQEYNSGKKYKKKGTLCGPNIPPQLKVLCVLRKLTMNQSLDTDSDHISYSSCNCGRYCLSAF
jgi:hypothetical protein